MFQKFADVFGEPLPGPCRARALGAVFESLPWIAFAAGESRLRGQGSCPGVDHLRTTRHSRQLSAARDARAALTPSARETCKARAQIGPVNYKYAGQSIDSASFMSCARRHRLAGIVI